MSDKKIEFEANIGNRTIVLNGEIRLSGGKNVLKESTIRKFGIDTIPGVVMPKGWKKDEIIGKTANILKDTKVSDTKIKLEASANETVKELEKNTRPKWSASRISAMDPERAEKEINSQTDIVKLVELYQFVRSKRVLRDLVQKRVYVLDPTNQFVPKPKNKPKSDPKVD